MFEMLGLNQPGVVGGNSDDGSNNKDRDLLPELSGVLRVLSSRLFELDVGLTSSRIGRVSEGGANLGGSLGGHGADRSPGGSSKDGARKHFLN